MTAVTERVAAGAAYLDEHDPDWWRADVERAIDLNRLALWMGNRCVLGQRCPLEALNAAPEWMSAYAVFSRRLSGMVDGSDVRVWAQGLGFYLPEDEDRDEADDWDSLTAEWRRVIEARRAS